MNGACQNVLPLVAVFVLLGIGCEDRGQTFRPHKVVDPSNKTNAPQFVRPARTEAIARIAELGGRTGPASPAPGERVSIVDLSGTEVTDSDLELMASLPELGYLDLTGTGITDEGLKHVAALKGLSVLKLEKTSVTGAGLDHLRGMRRLSSLYVKGTKIRESDLARLKGMKSLGSVLPFPQSAVKGWLIEEELVSTAWVTSKDKRLSLRLLAPKRQGPLSAPVVVMAELRNASKKDWVVLRPLADTWQVYMKRLAKRGPKGAVEYDMSQGIWTYQLSDYAFALLSPGDAIRNRIELSVSSFKGLDVAGEYFFTLRYSVDDVSYGAPKARLFPDRKQELWTGEIRSEELKITKSRE